MTAAHPSEETTGEGWHIKHLLTGGWMVDQPVLIILAATALIFGFIGYRQYLSTPRHSADLVDVLYADLQLLKLTSKVNGGNVPWTLNVARLLAPAVSGYAAIRGVMALQRGHVDRLRIQRARNHVVIVGTTPAAVAVARALHHQNRQVVMVDQNLTSDRMASLRATGALCLNGDATRPEVLRQARAHRATDVLALTDRDETNIDIALRAHSGVSRAMGYVSRPDLCQLLRIESIGRRGSASLDFINGHELTARILELATPPPTGLEENPVGREVVVMAPAALASQLLARLARSRPSAHVRVMGPDAADAVALARRGVSGLATLQVTVEPDVIDANNIDDMTRVGWAVVGGDGAETVGLALALSRRMRAGGSVTLVMPDPGHLAPLLNVGAGRGTGCRSVPINLVDALAWWNDADLVLGGTVEVLARATHANYVAQRHSAGSDSDGDGAMVAWEQLSPALRDSNRAQARHIWDKLAAVGCGLAPSSSGSTFAFTNAEIEQLAQIEHVRWTNERTGAGWKLGPRSLSTRHTPHLVAWAQLDEATRDLDRTVVRSLPRFLADVGYEIVRNNPIGISP